MISPDLSIILDFDSTFIMSETVDELAEICLKENERRNDIINDIQKITELGMTGKIGFSDSLQQRLNKLSVTKDHIHRLIVKLRNQVTGSIVGNRDFFINNYRRIYIVSGGFYEVILEVVQDFGIMKDHILANELRFDNRSILTGINLNNPLSRDHGKSATIRKRNIPRPILMVGDGYTDLEVKTDGAADYFLAFTENVFRPDVVRNADRTLSSFDEFVDLFQRGSLIPDKFKSENI